MLGVKGLSSAAFFTNEFELTSLGPDKKLMTIASAIKKVASHDVILLRTFPALCPPRTLLAACPQKVPDKQPTWLACIITKIIKNKQTIVCKKIKKPSTPGTLNNSIELSGLTDPP